MRRKIGKTPIIPIIRPGEILIRLVAPINKPYSTKKAKRVITHSAAVSLKKDVIETDNFQKQLTFDSRTIKDI